MTTYHIIIPCKALHWVAPQQHHQLSLERVCFPRAGRKRALIWKAKESMGWPSHLMSPWQPRNPTWWLSTGRPAPLRWCWSSWPSLGIPLPTWELPYRGKPTVYKDLQSADHHWRKRIQVLQPSPWDRYQGVHQCEEQEPAHPPQQHHEGSPVRYAKF